MTTSTSSGRPLLRVLLVLSFLALVCALIGTGQTAYADPPGDPGPAQTVDNGTFGEQTILEDTAGHRVDAHDGHIYFFADRYYWYGTSYQCGFDYRVSTSDYCGVKVYESPDANQWQYDGLALDPTVEQARWNGDCGGGAGGCYRPKVAYNAKNNDYVMWVNEARGADGSGYLVLTAPTPTGPFTLVGHKVMSYNRCPNGEFGARAIYGDQDLFVDDNGTAYLIYGAINKPDNNCPATTMPQHNIAIERLDDSYTAGTGEFTVYTVANRSIESPSFFRRGSTYYLLYSDPACPYCNNAGTGYATASSPTGTYTYRGVLTPSQLGGQPAGVTPLATENGTQYYYYLDRWNQTGTSTAISNQYLANYFFAPLAFTADGRVQPIPAVPSWQTQVLTRSSSTSIDALPVPATASYQPLVAAQRLVDSRAGLGVLQPGHAPYTFTLPAAFRKARAVALNVTATGAAGGGYFRVWGAGTTPATSTINYSAVRPTIANMAVVAPAPDGTIHVTANTSRAHLVIDITGFYPAGSSFVPALPARRILDTRSSTAIPAHGALSVSLFTNGVARTSRYLTTNITTLASDPGSLVVYDRASGSVPPVANAIAINRGTQASFDEVRVPVSGTITLYNDSPQAVHVLLDSYGHDDGTAMQMLANPFLLASTRTGVGPYSAPLQPGLSYPYDTARSGVPANASAAVVRLSTGVAGGTGFLAAYANQSGYSGTSSLNLVPGLTATNTLVVPLRDGRFDVYGRTITPFDLAVVIVGYIL